MQTEVQDRQYVSTKSMTILRYTLELVSVIVVLLLMYGLVIFDEKVTSPYQLHIQK